MRHDLLHAGGFLILGALAAATLNVMVPREWLTTIAGVPWLAVLVMEVESGVGEQAGELLTQVVPHGGSGEQADQVSGQAIGRGMELGDQQAASGSQDAKHLPDGGGAGWAGDVVQGQAGDHDVEAVVGQTQGLSLAHHVGTGGGRVPAGVVDHRR
jgi:hypothetical protein